MNNRVNLHAICALFALQLHFGFALCTLRICSLHIHTPSPSPTATSKDSVRHICIPVPCPQPVQEACKAHRQPSTMPTATSINPARHITRTKRGRHLNEARWAHVQSTASVERAWDAPPPQTAPSCWGGGNPCLKTPTQYLPGLHIECTSAAAHFFLITYFLI